jgi:pimeloyl-ACP methyl ester carboxylesterase
VTSGAWLGEPQTALRRLAEDPAGAGVAAMARDGGCTVASPLAMDTRKVRGPGGRTLEVVVEGPPDGAPLLWCHGTPQAAGVLAVQVRLGAERGLRHVSWSRPGYAGSDRHHGRRVADVAADAAAITDELGLDRVLVAGASGGGPHALALAALLGPRVRAAAIIAGVAPHEADGLVWLEGMGEENIAEFAAAERGEDVLAGHLEGAAAGLREVSGEQLVAALGDLFGEADRVALTGAVADELAAGFRRAVARGTDGWVDDDLAFVRPWGFDLGSIAVPVTVWQGEQDRMVPPPHGPWLAAHVPGADLRLDPAHGHVTLITDGYTDVLDALLAAAG